MHLVGPETPTGPAALHFFFFTGLWGCVTSAYACVEVVCQVCVYEAWVHKLRNYSAILLTYDYNSFASYQRQITKTHENTYFVHTLATSPERDRGHIVDVLPSTLAAPFWDLQPRNQDTYGGQSRERVSWMFTAELTNQLVRSNFVMPSWGWVSRSRRVGPLKFLFFDMLLDAPFTRQPGTPARPGRQAPASHAISKRRGPLPSPHSHTELRCTRPKALLPYRFPRGAWVKTAAQIWSYTEYTA